MHGKQSSVDLRLIRPSMDGSGPRQKYRFLVEYKDLAFCTIGRTAVRKQPVRGECEEVGDFI